MRYTARAVVAVALLLGVYVLAAGVVAALALGLYELAVHGFTGGAMVKLAVVTVLVSAGIGRGLWAGFRRRDDAPGVVLSAQEQPRLWAEVRYLADQVGTRPPDEIRLVQHVNAAVSESSRWLGLVAGWRRMYVGVPLLVGLSTRQLRSVLAHELGHYSGRHTELAGVTYRGKESLRRIITHLGRRSWVGGLFRIYARLYLAVANGVNRRQELEADRWSARLAGRSVAISALQELPVLDAGWSLFRNHYVGPGLEQRRRPRDLFAGFQQFWSASARQEELEGVRSDPPVEKRSIYDSHPSMSARVAALAALDAPDDPDDSGAAVELLDDVTATLRRLEEQIFSPSGLTAMPWEELVPASLAARTHGNACALMAAMESGGETKGDLAQALEAVRLGWSTDLAAPLLPAQATDEQCRLAAGQLVGDLVADALVESGRAAFRLSWGAGRLLVDEDGTALDPWSLAAAAVRSPAEAVTLVSWCEDHRAPLTHRPAPAGVAEVAPASQ